MPEDWRAEPPATLRRTKRIHREVGGTRTEEKWQTKQQLRRQQPWLSTASAQPWLSISEVASTSLINLFNLYNSDVSGSSTFDTV